MIAMNMKWAGITPEQYDEVRNIVKWETNAPKGGLFHVAYFDGNGLNVHDLWESAQDLNNFVEQRLMPGVLSIGITSQPTVEVYPTHAVFTPGYVSKKNLAVA
jgi:hypothetical protein